MSGSAFAGEMPTSAGGKKVILHYLLAVFVVVFSLPTSASAASVALNCATLPAVNELYDVDDVVSSSIDYSSDKLILTNSPSSDAVCTLARAVESSALDGKPLYQPVGRSYAGRDWERVAGLDAAVVSYNCRQKTKKRKEKQNTCTCVVTGWPGLRLAATGFDHTYTIPM